MDEHSNDFLLSHSVVNNIIREYTSRVINSETKSWNEISLILKVCPEHNRSAVCTSWWEYCTAVLIKQLKKETGCIYNDHLLMCDQQLPLKGCVWPEWFTVVHGKKRNFENDNFWVVLHCTQFWKRLSVNHRKIFILKLGYQAPFHECMKGMRSGNVSVASILGKTKWDCRTSKFDGCISFASFVEIKCI